MVYCQLDLLVLYRKKINKLKNKPKYMRLFYLVLLCVAILQPAEAQNWRLSKKVISTRVSNPDFIVDSTQYHYSKDANRGSSKMADTIHCDSLLTYRVNDNTSRDRMVQTFYPDGKLQSASFYNPRAADPQLYRLDSFYYTANGLLSEEVEYNAAGPVSRTVFSYNSDGNIIERMYYEWSEDIKDWELSYRFSNTQSGAISTDSTIYEEYIVLELRNHGVNNRVEQSVSYVHKNNALDTVRRRLYFYDANSRLICDSLQKYENALWETYTYHTYGYDNVTGNLVKHLEMKYPGYSHVPFFYGIETDYTYNSMGYITAADMRGSYVNVTWIEKHTKYDYEMYWPAGITLADEAAFGLHLYPVPTAGLLQLSATFKSAVSFIITVVDPTGKVVMRLNDATEGVYDKQLLLHNLPDGNYVLTLEGDAGHISKPFVLLR